MSDKLCLQWNDFRKNVNFAFGRLRTDKEFTDVTLACEDGQQMEAHKVVLAASSPFFERILQKSKHPHPLIYLKGFQSKNFLSILDFLYFGEANVYQEDLDSFLAIAEEIQLKGLTKQTSTDLIQEQEEIPHPKPIQEGRDLTKKSPNPQLHLKRSNNDPSKTSTAIAISNQSSMDLQALDEKVKSMMEKGQNLFPAGKRANGTLKQEIAYICKICGKEGLTRVIQSHVESNHLEGICIPCDICDKNFSSRNSLRMHKSRFHK